VFCSMNYDRKLGQIMDIKESIRIFLNEVKEDEIKSVNVNMIIDKNVSQSYIDSLKSIIKFTGVNSIYRVYKNDSIDYKDNLSWYGISE
ncbi:hypothetical protein, partial [Ulvibacter litoralis]|uniref:hypothetical protein n=2 Tax=Ulvibacter litoralis TaxID=227084 RepID=UPI001E5E2C75